MDSTAPVKGKHVLLVPCVRGVSPRALLGQIWHCLETTPQAIARTFWGQTVEHEHMRGDLEAFMQMAARRLFLAVYDRRTNAMGGAVWWEEIVPGHKANIGFAYRRALWGPPAREASMLATAWAFEHLRASVVWGFTPWVLAKRHGERCGWKLVATLPGLAIVQGEPRDLYVMRKEQG